MPQFYRILKADPMGDPWTPNKPNAKPIQQFWCQVEGVDLPVRMGKQVPNVPSLVEGHYGVLETAKSQAGNDYMKFVGMQTPQGMQRPRYDAAAPAETQATVHPSDQKDTPLWFAPYAMKINFIYDEMRNVSSTPLTQAQVLDEAKRVETEPIGDGNITKAELEDIFGGSMADPVELDK